MSKGRTAVRGTGIGLGTLLALPAAAHAEDFTVTNLSNSGAGSLREAIADANDNPGADQVLFKSKLSGQIELAAGEGLLIAGDVVIRGPGARRVSVTKAGTGGSILVPDTDGSSTAITVSGLSLTGNVSAYNGGAIAAYGDEDPLDLTLSRVTISGNEATGQAEGEGTGGGVAFTGGPNSSLVIEDSTISGNQATGGAGSFGGGVYVTQAALLIQNSTISGNSTESSGGGLGTRYIDQAQIEMRSSTVTGNHAQIEGGGLYENNGGIQVHGSIVAGNTATDSPQFQDMDDGPWPVAFSLIGAVGDADIDPDGGGNLLNVDANLKPLKNNGGPTNTHAFKKSPAKNKGPSDAPNQDQRGAKRKGKADIGAYELVKCEGVIVNRVGTAKKDKLKGTKKADGILGLGGNDKLAGKKGKDGLCGGKGKDKLKGGPGKDKLDGGPGKDKEVQ